MYAMKIIAILSVMKKFVLIEFPQEDGPAMYAVIDVLGYLFVLR